MKLLKKCDQWLEMFKKVHDKFRELVLTDRYRKQHIVMNLSFCKFFSFSDKNVKGRTIDIDLKQYDTIIQEGVTISLDEVNKVVYKYLLANVLDHYLSVNYAGTTINNIDIDWNYTLYSDSSFCSLSGLYESEEYGRIVTSIIANHNLNQSSEQIIDNLRQAIYNQQLIECFDSGINHSIKQYEHIISDSEDVPFLSKKMN